MSEKLAVDKREEERYRKAALEVSFRELTGANPFAQQSIRARAGVKEVIRL